MNFNSCEFEQIKLFLKLNSGNFRFQEKMWDEVDLFYVFWSGIKMQVMNIFNYSVNPIIRHLLILEFLFIYLWIHFQFCIKQRISPKFSMYLLFLLELKLSSNWKFENKPNSKESIFLQKRAFNRTRRVWLIIGLTL